MQNVWSVPLLRLGKMFASAPEISCRAWEGFEKKYREKMGRYGGIRPDQSTGIRPLGEGRAAGGRPGKLNNDAENGSIDSGDIFELCPFLFCRRVV